MPVYLGEQYVDNPMLSDVILLDEDRRFYAHIIFLLGSSDTFRATFDGEHFAPHFLGLQLSKPFMLKEQQMQKGNTYNQCYSSQNLYSHNIGYQCTRRQSSSKYLCIPLLASWQDQREILACAD
ncbi:uncharacterized protein [Pyrus communis]|uniref:uncharacterized protein isoform X5 n=1 Tax=Pyrus communis TaxID=23211 RepID=UPI0035C18A83